MTPPESVLLALELTRQCNLLCQHCYVSANPFRNDQHHVSEEQWLQCLNEASANGIERIQFIGGEATLHSSLCTLIKRTGELGFADVELFSNATRLNSSLLRALRRNTVRLATSLYGDDVQLHDSFTGVKGSFERTLRNIERAIDLGISVRIAVVRDSNEREIIENTIEFARKLGVEFISADVVRAFGRGKRSGNTVRNCDACGVSVLRVCSDGRISGCSMSGKPSLGTIQAGLRKALQQLPIRPTRSVDDVRRRSSQARAPF